MPGNKLLRQIPQDVLDLMNVFEMRGKKTRLAGGCVRDLLLKKKVHDYDLATEASVEDMKVICADNTIRYIESGVKHGTLTLLSSKSRPVECTTLRRDLKSDGRHAEVSFDGVNFEEDARRRDFSINALYLSAQGELFDYVGGLKDLKTKKLRFIGRAQLRIEEDHLRILRFVRFKHLLKLSTDQKEEAIIKKSSFLIQSLSHERITEEFKKGLLNSPQTSLFLTDLFQLKLTKILCPNLTTKHLKLLKNFSWPTDKDLKWISFLFLSGKSKVAVENSWPYFILTKKDKKNVNHLFQLLEAIKKYNGKISTALNAYDSHLEPDNNINWQLTMTLIGLKFKLISRQNLSNKIRSLSQTIRKHKKRIRMPVTSSDLLERSIQGPRFKKIRDQLLNDYRDLKWTKRQEGLKRLDDLCKKSLD